MKTKALLLALSLMLCAAGPAAADGATWTLDARFKRMFDSYTSYEFGQPFDPKYAPLSRLEFDLNTWWGGVELRRDTGLWSIGLEALTNVSNRDDGIMADSDWEDAEHTKVRTTYSESCVRLKPSYDVRATADVSLAQWLGLPKGLDLRPLGGVRYQYFSMVTFNGTQWSTYGGEESTIDLPGDGIAFRQTYWHYFVGLRGAWQPMVEKYPGLRLTAQLDWAWVKGDNKDHHLLRAGTRITEESTSGQAWHAALGLEAAICTDLYLDIQAEYLTIDTSGSHRLYNPEYGIDLTWDNGVNVWSQQCTVSLALRYAF